MPKRPTSTQHPGLNESVYNLIPPKIEEPVKPAMYKSKFPPDVPPSYSSFGTTTTSKLAANTSGDFAHPDRQGGHHKFIKPHATMGELKTTLRGTTMYIRKGDGTMTVPDPEPFQYVDRTGRRDPVPKRDEKPVMGLVSAKDFVRTNAIENILRVPKKSGPTNVDYRLKPDYGKVPSYLEDVKREIGEEREYIQLLQEQETMTSQHGSDHVECLGERERQDLLERLKKRWEEVNHIYQNLQFVNLTSTGSKKAQKEACERELDQIETDIQSLSKKYVFVQ